jgi:hypothetical protein
MKKNSVVMSKEEIINHHNNLDEIKEKKAMNLKEKKNYMNKLYNDKKKEIPLSEEDKAKLDEREKILQRVKI